MKLVSIFILSFLGLSCNGAEARTIAESELRELLRWSEWDWQALTNHNQIRHKRQAETQEDNPPVSADDVESNPTETQVDVTTIRISPTTSQNFDNTVTTTTSTSFIASFTTGSESFRQTLQNVSNAIQGITANVSNIINDVIKAVNKMADGMLNKPQSEQPQRV